MAMLIATALRGQREEKKNKLETLSKLVPLPYSIFFLAIGK